ncbi:MAG: GTPase Era [Chitinophagaceae bacterium]|nr:MAG: GTPase Era [Chitinophagaceae bacterium]
MHNIESDQLRVSITENGAELKSVIHQQNGVEYMWSGDPAFWAKTSPVLFPIVGTLKENAFHYQGKKYSLTRHGFARDQVFRVVAQQLDTITFGIDSTGETLTNYPFPFRFQIRYAVVNDELAVTYGVHNTSLDTMPFSVGGHPAFKLPLVEGTAYDDYQLVFEKEETAPRWPISKDGLIEKQPLPFLSGSRVLPLSKELFKSDAVVLKHLASRWCKLRSDKTDHGLEFTFGNFPFLGLWAAGKSTLLNALMQEKLAIVSPKVQTTRHRIKGILSTADYQIIFSDTPGIIDPKYRLHEKMMHAVRSALEDADLALLLVDINEDWSEADAVFSSLRLKVPSVVVVNKIDKAPKEKLEEATAFFKDKKYTKELAFTSALSKTGIDKLLASILSYLPEGEAFYAEDEISDLPTKFFVAEMIREKIYTLFEDEIPYQTTVVVNEFKQKSTLIKIRAEIIVQRESQKAIILGQNGKMIKQIGTAARQEIEKFLEQKVFLELFVKVRPNWRENELYLKEYGY